MIEEEWREVDKADMSNDDIIDFFRLHCVFSININAKDDATVRWIKKHPDWIMEKKPQN